MQNLAKDIGSHYYALKIQIKKQKQNMSNNRLGLNDDFFSAFLTAPFTITKQKMLDIFVLNAMQENSIQDSKIDFHF